MGISFLIKAVRGFDPSRCLREVKRVSEKHGKAQCLVIADMLWCSLRYGAGPMDYALFDFCGKPSTLRKTYITRGINNRLVKKYNDPSAWKLFDNKTEFNRRFAPYIRRAWTTVDEMTMIDLQLLRNGKEEILYKPLAGTCGKGIRKISCGESVRHLFSKLKRLENGMLEEIVVQHPVMAALYPYAVNTVRVMTLYHNQQCTPLFAFLRIGNGGNVVDNLNSGGIAAKLDVHTGRILMPAADKDGIVYETHPMTGTPLVGFTVPHWEEVLSVCAEAAALVPEVGYVGWDVCVRENDVLLIEGNCYPGHDILQLPAYTPDGVGLLEEIEPYL